MLIKLFMTTHDQWTYEDQLRPCGCCWRELQANFVCQVRLARTVSAVLRASTLGVCSGEMPQRQLAYTGEQPQPRAEHELGQLLQKSTAPIKLS